ncbi:hypothetical protein NE555_17500, partial [Alistipes onderdonkii]|nr:hypothetical protein [Alistipes onderdonkii]
MNFAENMSPLGNASANDCADYVLTLFSDLTRKVTMQNPYHDGGFASMGMSRRAMKTYEKGMRFEMCLFFSCPGELLKKGFEGARTT